MYTLWLTKIIKFFKHLKKFVFVANNYIIRINYSILDMFYNYYIIYLLLLFYYLN